jgi:hypothetical protein
VLSVLAAKKKGEQEIIVLPNDYRGYEIIVYDQERGTPTHYEGKKRIYQIPPSGVLKTQFTGSYGWR